MIEPSDRPRLFGVPPGADFPRILVDGLTRRLGSHDPAAWPHVEIFVNTRRMQRRLKALLAQGPARLLPRVRLVTDLADDMRFADLPPAVSPLRRRLELSQLIARLLEQAPDLAPRSALFDLADSLAQLLDEMQGEGVPFDAIRGLVEHDLAEHWQNALRFLSLLEPLMSADAPGSEGRMRIVTERLCALWQDSPPDHPVIVAGSTGSRGPTAMLMQAVARLPQGAVVLPGFDFDMPRLAWDRLDRATAAEDHPQFRFARLMRALGMAPDDVAHWADAPPPCHPRNRLVSLALRPAPVTDQWLTEGPALEGLAEATADVSLIEAPSPRAEAAAIAVALREAVEAGTTAALISPDRVLTRQVTAALDRWGILPDDSAGQPLPLSPPGRLLRQISTLIGQKVTPDALMALLKHPLVGAGKRRGEHLLQTREFELWLRRRAPAFVEPRHLQAWAEDGDETRKAWAAWLADLLPAMEGGGPAPLEAQLRRHMDLAERIAAGFAGQPGDTELWREAAGEEARKWVDALASEAEHGGALDIDEYAALFAGVMNMGSVRDSILGHPDVMIWGTLEARVQGAELVVLAGLNEGTWPEPPRPDPWLNRMLRDKAGLLLPDREIGLAAHDFQQAICARRVILSRAIRNEEAQTVPARWLNRLTNLLGGLGKEGEEALKAMRGRGARLLELGAWLDKPAQEVPPAPRPSPRPPVEMRPREISITDIQRLIRDPYAVYAKRVLRLAPLDPLRRQPDAAMRGTAIHRIVERFVRDPLEPDPADAVARLLRVADGVLAAYDGWPTTRRLWRARIGRLADWFIEGEFARRQAHRPLALEVDGRLQLPRTGVTLKGKLDRIDLSDTGMRAVYDYKTGQVPTSAQREHFDKQLILSAAVAERGVLKDAEPGPVAEMAYIGMGTNPVFNPESVDPGAIDAAIAELEALLGQYQQRERGYTSRRAVEKNTFGGDYDHLARFGEWDTATPPEPEDVG